MDMVLHQEKLLSKVLVLPDPSRNETRGFKTVRRRIRIVLLFQRLSFEVKRGEGTRSKTLP